MANEENGDVGGPIHTTADVLPRRWLSPAEWAAVHGLSRSSVYAAMARGELPSVRLGGRRLIRANALDQLLDEERQRARPKCDADETRR